MQTLLLAISIIGMNALTGRRCLKRVHIWQQIWSIVLEAVLKIISLRLVDVPPSPLLTVSI
jgi:hypothetical protein